MSEKENWYYLPNKTSFPRIDKTGPIGAKISDHEKIKLNRGPFDAEDDLLIDAIGFYEDQFLLTKDEAYSSIVGRLKERMTEISK